MPQAEILFRFWLTFDRSGSLPRVTRNQPSLAPSERAMECRATLPAALFAWPSLRAEITVGADQVSPPVFDVAVLEAAVVGAIDGQIKFTVIEPGREDE